MHGGAAADQSQPRLVTWPAPEDETPSPDYEVTVNGTPLFVWAARVREEIEKPADSIWTHKLGGGAESAAFVVFDFSGPVEVEVRPKRPFRTATLHPARCGIEPTVAGDAVRFRLDRPSPLTLMLDGSDERPLHLFADSPETEVPQPEDPNVLYFGPGVHEVEKIALRDGQTLYLAGGAVVRGKLPVGEKLVRSERTGLYGSPSGPVVAVSGARAVRICGRGILDGGLMPHPSRQLIGVNRSQDVRLEGIVLRNSPNWNVNIRQSRGVLVERLKIISGRLNSDGVNCVNSTDVHIRGCFIRNHDDSIAVKANSPEGECARITVEDCVIWNDWGFALGVTYETRAPIHDVLYRNCAVIFVRHWAMGVLALDAGTVSNVRFEDIAVEDLALPARRFGREPLLIRVAVATDKMWGTDAERGHIRDVAFRNVTATGNLLPASEIMGFDADHCVERVTLENLTLPGRRALRADDGRFRINEFTRDVEFR